jgi:hypothetical protein
MPLPHLAAVAVERVQQVEHGVHLWAHARARTAACPRCGRASARAIAKAQQAAWRKNRPATLPSDHVVAEKAFADQYAKLATDQVDPNDPLSKTRLPGAAAPGDGGS